MAARVDCPEVWAELASIYDATRALPGDGARRVAEILVRELRCRGVARVLDLGCGTGRWSAPLAAAGLQVVGVDRSPQMLAAIAVKPGGCDVRAVRCDAARLPFARAFDAALMCHFLHLQPSLAPIAAELGRVLRPGATLLAIDAAFVPHPLAERITTLVLRRLAGSFEPYPRGDRSRERLLLEELASAAGAGPVEVVPGIAIPLARSARDHLTSVRHRVWSAYRVYEPAAVEAAADEAERVLLAEGVDLDAAAWEPIGVRLLVARMLS